MSKRVGEVTTANGSAIVVSASIAGVEIDGAPGVDPDDASALSRLILDAGHESRRMRERSAAEPRDCPTTPRWLVCNTDGTVSVREEGTNRCIAHGEGTDGMRFDEATEIAEAHNGARG